MALQEEASEALHSAQRRAHIVCDAEGKRLQITNGLLQFRGPFGDPALEFSRLAFESISGFAQRLLRFASLGNFGGEGRVGSGQFGGSLLNSVFQSMVRLVSLQADLMEEMRSDPDGYGQENKIRKAE